MSAEIDLPASWARQPLETVTEVHDNLREPVNSSERAKRVGPYPYYGATGQVGWIDDFRQEGEYVLLGEDGAPFFEPTKEKAYLVSGKCWVNNHAHVLKGREGLCLNRYLLYALNHSDYRGYANGTTRLKLTQAAMRQLPINLAPINEQHRIVAKIEELFSELDKGIENLKTAQAQLKVYRQALLKHAFEGKLTVQWREQNRDQLETAALLKRIQQERAQRYQQQLADWEANGKQGSKPKAPKPLPPLTAEGLAELPELPEGWGWVKVGDVGILGTGVTPLKGRSDFYENGTVPWVTSGALNENYVSNASDYVTHVALKETNLRLYPKHTLLIALYGEGKTRGKCSELLIEATTNQAIAAIVLEGKAAEIRQYMKWFFQKNYGDIRLKSSGGVQPNLNLGIIENTVFPMCSLAEAKYVVEALESKLSEVDQLEQTLTTSLQQAEALRQSILKKAFSGQLVPQDPHDESASTLLARIKAERANVVVKPRKNSTGDKLSPVEMSKEI